MLLLPLWGVSVLADPTVIKVPASPGALAAAVAKAATIAGDVELQLASGVHQTSQPITLTDAHATAGKSLSVVAEDGSSAAPTISGGVAITGPWTQDATNKMLWSATVPAEISTDSQRMQAWQGDQRLTLARTADMTYKMATAGHSSVLSSCLTEWKSPLLTTLRSRLPRVEWR